MLIRQFTSIVDNEALPPDNCDEVSMVSHQIAVSICKVVHAVDGDGGPDRTHPVQQFVTQV